MPAAGLSPGEEPFMRLCRQAVVFALIITLATPWIAGAAPRPQGRAAVERSASSVSDTLRYLWGYLTSLWEAAGSSPDPLGAPTPTTDEGSSPDPLG
jgi:hypothetical protein